MLHFKYQITRALRSLLIVISFIIAAPSYADHKKITIIVPLEHEAMNQIISGIKETLSSMDIDIQIQNAHSDPNIMLAIIKQLKDQNVDIIMPIGTSSCQMTISHIKNQPIVCVAANPIDQSKHPLVTGVNDEIPISYPLSKLHKLKNIAVIYSASEKIAPEIVELQKYAAESNVKLHLAMIQNLVDMPLAVRSAPNNIEAFVILKDHLVVSGVNILMQEATKRSIPIIASDEGSVSKGATISIGVREKDIGIESGLLAKKILQGTNPGDIPQKTMNSLVLFVNEKTFSEQKILSKEDILGLKMKMLSFGKE